MLRAVAGPVLRLSERVIVDRPHNDIQPWKYHKLMEVFGGGPGFDVRTGGKA